MNILKLLKITLLSTTVTTAAFAQEFKSNEVSKSVQKKVMEFPDFSKYEASCKSLYDCMSFDTEKDSFSNSDYHTHVKAYKLNLSKDQLFDARLALGLFRSLVTSTRFVFDQAFSYQLMDRAAMILQDLNSHEDNLKKFKMNTDLFLYR